MWSVFCIWLHVCVVHSHIYVELPAVRWFTAGCTLTATCRLKETLVSSGRKTELDLYSEECKSSANIDFHLQFCISVKRPESRRQGSHTHIQEGGHQSHPHVLKDQKPTAMRHNSVFVGWVQCLSYQNGAILWKHAFTWGVDITLWFFSCKNIKDNVIWWMYRGKSLHTISVELHLDHPEFSFSPWSTPADTLIHRRRGTN